MPEARDFRPGVRRELTDAVARLGASLGGGEEDLLRLDLHCHDRNSDVPDETLGRLLRLPETWLKTDRLVRTLRENGADAVTVTNHNNARSCWELLDKGEDVLPAAEFSCTLPDLEVGVHVLTFGFSPAQEEKLKVLRRDLYRFLEFTADADIPTVLAHPLHFYSPKGTPHLDLMDRFALLFERFEGVNGQRDAWQNLLTLSWLEGLDEEGIRAASRRTGIRPGDFCRRPFRKVVAGGSDCHMGIFAGSTGTLLASPGWRKSGRRRADLALDALRRGEMAPYGSHCEEEKLTVAFLDYFCQVALRMEDPGLIRLLLHRGTPTEKLQALLIGNGMFELRRHKYTSRFLELFHQSLMGKKPGILTSMFTSPAYKPLLADMETLADARNQGAETLVPALTEILPRMFGRLSTLLADRIIARNKELERRGMKLEGDDLFSRFELPLHLRSMFGAGAQDGGLMRQDGKPDRGAFPFARRTGPDANFDLGKWSDGLPFPALASSVLAGAAFAASKVLYGKRPFLESFAERIGRHEHPKRALWLTDTLFDKNGVSHVLQAMLAESSLRDLPIDFLTCAPAGRELPPELARHPNLRLLPAIAEFELPFYKDQAIRLPGLLELQKLFLEGGYDRIVCSTEAPMGLYALYLKSAFNVPAFFYVHTDWMDFARRTLNFEPRKLDRLRRILRAFYRRFDGVFLLNTEQKAYFASPEMGLAADRLFLTGHWADARFRPRPPRKVEVLGARPEEPVLLYAGRLSEEKGVMELPAVLRAVRERLPRARLAFAGTGPCLDRLKAAVPDGLFLGWLDPEGLAEAYASADLLLLPSWFDTFSCSLLEALSCGLPAVAFRSKGPRDILAGNVGGVLADDAMEMARVSADLLADQARLRGLGQEALRRAGEYRSGAILSGLLRDLGLGGSPSLPRNPGESVPEESAFLGELMALMQP